MPEQVSEHALEHFLLAGDDQLALILAKKNYLTQPGGQAALLLVQVHSATGHFQQAFALLEPLLASEFRSASLYATAGLLYRLIGDMQSAETFDNLALTINPSAVSDKDWFHETLLLT